MKLDASSCMLFQSYTKICENKVMPNIPRIKYNLIITIISYPIIFNHKIFPNKFERYITL